MCINILNEIIFPDPFQLKLHFYLNIYILNYLLFNYFYLFKNDTHQIKKNILQFSSFIILGLTNYYFFIFLFFCKSQIKRCELQEQHRTLNT